MSFYLSENADKPECWRKVLTQYKVVLKLKAESMKTGKGKELQHLDAWYQDELPKLISSRKEKHITHKELCQLMKWKLTRGKFRPRLTELAASNEEKLVEECSKDALSKLPDMKSALTCLCVLKGVGPATASGILAAACPTKAPFMADESMMSVAGLQPLAYTHTAYERYAGEINKLKTTLNKNDAVKDWTAHNVELALWTYFIGEKFNPGMFSLEIKENSVSTSIKRSSETVEMPTKSRKRKRRQ